MNKNQGLNLRISKIRSVFCGDDNHKFAECLGISDQRASSICTGNKNAGPKMLDLILSTFTKVQRTWLYFGDGDMLNPEPQASEQVNNSVDGSDVRGCIYQGTEIHTVEHSELDRLITLLESKDKQINRLIDLLEQKNKK